jgi:hypothetical protein
MKTVKQRKQDIKEEAKHGGISTMAAAVTGAIVGAGVVVAGAVVLNEKNNREKVEELKDEVADKFAEVKEKGDKLGNSIKYSVQGGVADAKKAIS